MNSYCINVAFCRHKSSLINLFFFSFLFFWGEGVGWWGMEIELFLFYCCLQSQCCKRTLNTIIGLN
jgi:hypothetical protein